MPKSIEVAVINQNQILLFVVANLDASRRLGGRAKKT